MRYSCKTKDRSLPLFIDSIGTDWPQEEVIRPNGYPYVHWLQSEKGSGEVSVGGKTYPLAEGDGILILPHIPHTYHKTTPEWKTAYFTFGGSLAQEILQHLSLRGVSWIHDKDGTIYGILSSLLRMDIDDSAFTTIASSFVYGFLLQVKKYTDQIEKKPALPEPVVMIIDYMQNHYAEDISHDTLSDLTHYSPQYITRLVRQVQGQSPFQYLQAIRIQKAKEMLAGQPDLSVLEISELCGFHDVSNFIRQFKKNEKTTPAAYARQFRDK